MMAIAEVVGLIILGLILLIALVGIGTILWILLYQHRRICTLEIEIEKFKSSKYAYRFRETDLSEGYENRVTLYEADETNDDDKNIRPLNSSRLPGKPRYTIKIKKEKANYYGAEAQISQLIHIAQNYYKDFNKSDKTVPAVDEVDITSNSKDDKYFRSIKRRSILEGRPTSVLMNPSGIDTHDKGIFCYKTIGQEGGILEISGVTLKIPKDAIAESTRFTLGVIWDENLRPKLTNKQALLSPIVICQPSLKFKHPVQLSFPHCAVNVSEDWKLKFIMKEDDIGETSDWRAIDDDDIVNIHVTTSRINLELHHFTLYTCIGEGVVGKTAAKTVKLVAFTSRLQIGSPYKARIYCINDYKKEMEDLEDIEKRLEGKMADANVPLFIHDDGGNISVTSSYISENWILIGNKTEEMDFELVWHALTPSCTFIFKPGKSTIKEIICEFQSLQVTQKNKIAKLKVADYFEQKIPNSRLVPIADDPQEELFRSLSVLLDPKTVTHDIGDYRTLAEKVNCDGQEIKWLEQQPNPTEIVLHKYLSHGGKLTDLRQILIDIERPDAVETLDKFLKAKTICEGNTNH